MPGGLRPGATKPSSLQSGVSGCSQGLGHHLSQPAFNQPRASDANRPPAGQLGDGTLTDSPSPVAVVGLPQVSTLAGGGFHTCAGTSDGGVACWGSNDSGQLGDGTTTDHQTPAPVAGVIF